MHTAWVHYHPSLCWLVEYLAHDLACIKSSKTGHMFANKELLIVSNSCVECSAQPTQLPLDPEIFSHYSLLLSTSSILFFSTHHSLSFLFQSIAHVLLLSDFPTFLSLGFPQYSTCHARSSIASGLANVLIIPAKHSFLFSHRSQIVNSWNSANHDIAACSKSAASAVFCRDLHWGEWHCPLSIWHALRQQRYSCKHIKINIKPFFCNSLHRGFKHNWPKR